MRETAASGAGELPRAESGCSGANREAAARIRAPAAGDPRAPREPGTRAGATSRRPVRRHFVAEPAPACARCNRGRR